MSMKLAGFAFEARLGTQTRKLILMKLVDCCRDDGSKIFPAVASIALAAECSERTVQRTLREFEGIGLLERVREGGRHGPGAASCAQYRLDVGRLERLAAEGWPGLEPAGAADDDGERDGPADGPRAEDGVPTGDMVSPLDGPERGDAMSPLGGLGVTFERARGDTIVSPEPLREPLRREREARGSAGEGADGGEGQASQKARRDEAADDGEDDGLARFRRRWPTTRSDNPARVEAAWGRLTPAERETAIERIDAVLAAHKADRRGAHPSGASYLGDRLWTALDLAAGRDAAQGAPAVSPFVPPWTRGWWGVAFWRIDAGQPPERLRKMVHMAECYRIGSAPEDRPAAAARAETLAYASSDEPRAAAWARWLNARGFDVRERFAGKPFAVWLPAHDPPDEARAETADDMANELARR
jgi:DNA-binding transcriptional ArsR family regulator